MTADETSQPLELLVAVRRDQAATLGAQIEDQLRCSIREGTLRPGTRVPSTRDLARQIGVSRRVVVDAYAQLAAEGYLTVRQGARPHVAATARPVAASAPAAALRTPARAGDAATSGGEAARVNPAGARPAPAGPGAGDWPPGTGPPDDGRTRPGAPDSPPGAARPGAPDSPRGAARPGAPDSPPGAARPAPARPGAGDWPPGAPRPDAGRARPGAPESPPRETRPAAAPWVAPGLARLGAPPRYDLRPSVPDVSTFPRAVWLRCLRETLADLPDAELGYGDPRGVAPLREALADQLGRVRGVVADPERIVVTSGYSQGLALICHALRAAGARRIVLEDPCNPEQALIAARAGLEPIPVTVDAHGLRVDALPAADAVVVTPAHQHPTGAVLSGERRNGLLEWLERHGAIAIEDDYDAEYRYDRAAVGALQGLAPHAIVYAGSVSKTLAPALRLGWLVLPAHLLDATAAEKHLADQGSPGIDQHAFARFLARGELDRHLRRMRARYRARRDALVEALADALPDATVDGVAAGLHLTVRLPPSVDEPLLRAEAQRRRIAFNTLGDYRPGGPPTLMLGYAQTSEPGLRAAAGELAAAVRAAQRRR